MGKESTSLEYTPTVSADIILVPSSSNPQVSYQIWDCAGDPNFLVLEKAFLVGAKIAFIFSGGEYVAGRSYTYWKDLISEINPGIAIHHVSTKKSVERKARQLARVLI